jgi:hypothetical protein
VDKICRDGDVVYEAVPQGFATSQVSRVEDIQSQDNDASAIINIGVATAIPVSCDPGEVHARNGGIDTLVLRTGPGPDDHCTDPAVLDGIAVAGSYATRVLSPENIDGIAIEFVSASGVDLATGTALTATLQLGEPTPGSATGPWLARVDGGVVSPYVSNTFVDPATVDRLLVGAYADADAAGMTSAGHQYTVDVVYKFRYIGGNVISQAATLVARAHNGLPPP